MILHSEQLRELLAALDAAEANAFDLLKKGQVRPNIEVAKAFTLLEPRPGADGQFQMFTVVRAMPSVKVQFGWDIYFDVGPQS